MGAGDKKIKHKSAALKFITQYGLNMITHYAAKAYKLCIHYKYMDLLFKLCYVYAEQKQQHNT